MEWLIPTQTLQTENIQLGPITHSGKPLVPLAYKDSDQYFPSLSILLPSLKIKSFDNSMGHFIISLADSPQILAKLQTMQDTLLTEVGSNYTTWFSKNHPMYKKPSDVRAGFQPLIHGTDLHLYCPTQQYIAQSVPFYSNGKWSETGIQTALLQPGSRVRIALRIQGISFHINATTGHWSGKFRLQHKLLALLL